MVAKTSLFWGKKGGTGKTTRSLNAAIGLTLNNFRTLLLDLDATLQSYDAIDIRNRDKITPSPDCIPLRGKKINEHIYEYAHCGKYDHIIVDAGGMDSVESRSALTYPDVDLYIPLKINYTDINTIKDVYDVLDELEYDYEKIKIIPNEVSPFISESDIQDFYEFIRKNFSKLTITNTVIYSRASYARSLGHGLCTIEYDKLVSTGVPKSSLEEVALFEEMFKTEFTACDIPRRLQNLKGSQYVRAELKKRSEA